MTRLLLIAAAAASLFAATAAQAGPFILAGTDADDHGSASVTSNLSGWLFMQRALENIDGGVTTGFKTVTILGSTSNAATAANSAFDKSTLVAAGWSRVNLSVANFGAFFSAGGNLGTGILMMDSGDNIGGGVNGTAFDPYASNIDQFLQSGGGLFSQANGYSWLTTLVSGVSVTPNNTGGIGSGLTKTAAGNAAFPGLTNADLSTGPFHQRFTTVGGLTVLAVDSNNDAVILGGVSGSITSQVPEPTSLALVGLALAGIAFSVKRKRA